MIPVGIPGEIWAWLAFTALGVMLLGQLVRDPAAREARRVATWRREHREQVRR